MDKGVSLKPSEAVAGGLLDDVTVDWKECAFEMWDYNGKIPAPVPALKVAMEEPDTKEEHTQYWSCGRAQDWAPSNDGKQLVAVGSATAIRTSSNVFVLLKSLVDCKFPEDKLGNDISELQGLRAHMSRVAAPKRPGLAKAKRTAADGTEYEDTILVVSDIHNMPWEKAKPTGAPKTAGVGTAKAAAPTKAAPPAEGEAQPIDEEATTFMMEALADAGDDGIPRKTIPTVAFQKLTGNPNRNAIAKRVYEEDFLSAGPWVYDGTVIKMG